MFHLDSKTSRVNVFTGRRIFTNPFKSHLLHLNLRLILYYGGFFFFFAREFHEIQTNIIFVPLNLGVVYMSTILFIALLTLSTLNDFGEKTLFLQPSCPSVFSRSIFALSS